MKIETRAVHAGRQIDPSTGAVTTPIYLSTTFERSPDGEYPLGFSYSREDNPNRRALEECLADLEGGKEALVFSSGLAVATALVQGLEPGDHIVVPDDVYFGLRKVIGEVFGKWGIETTYVDMTQPGEVRAALKPATRLIWVETPSNPLMKITDLAAIAALARQTSPGIVTVCDGTFATPILQHPLDCGIDMVCHSTTKYIGGHSDVVGGGADHPARQLPVRACAPCAALWRSGAFALRLLAHAARHRYPALPRAGALRQRSARGRASLKRHAAVEAVHYPGLPDHPGYEIAARQMSAFGGMLSFQVAGGRETAMKVAARCQLFIRATSLGGAHSLIEHRASVEGPGSRTPQNLLRLSVGLEHPDDLIADLNQALGAAV